MSIQLDDITIKVTKKKIKNLHLKVLPPHGDAYISAPMRMSLDAIRDFVLSKRDWIRKQKKRVQSMPQALSHEYRDGEKHYVWGNAYPLKVIAHDKTPKVMLEQAYLHLYITLDADKEKKQHILEMWYRKQLQQVLPALIIKWEEPMGVKVNQFAIQKMKTRWGSCSPHSGKIRFNLELAKKPLIILEYIVIHEMVHLLEASHNHRFKAFMDRFMPEWRVHRHALNHGEVSDNNAFY